MFLSDLVPNITLQVPNCLDEVAMKALVEGARRFYRETTLWREHRSFSLVAGADAVRLRVPDETVVSAVRSVTFEGRALQRVDSTDYAAYEGRQSYHPEVYLPYLRDGIVRIGPATVDAQNNAYNIEYVLVPTLDADELDVDGFAAEYEKAYEYAALSSLFSMPLFANPALSNLNEARYADIAQQAINKAQGLLDGGAIVTEYGGL